MIATSHEQRGLGVSAQPLLAACACTGAGHYCQLPQYPQKRLQIGSCRLGTLHRTDVLHPSPAGPLQTDPTNSPPRRWRPAERTSHSLSCGTPEMRARLGAAALLRQPVLLALLSALQRLLVGLHLGF